MGIPVKSDLNLGGNELQNAVVQNLSSAPSNPKVGQEYYDTTTNQKFIWNGTAWIDETSQGDYTFQNGVENVSGTRNVQLKLNTSESSGLTIFSANSNGLKINVTEASTSAKGIIEIATDGEVTTGTSEILAVNPKQLATKVTKNADITAGTGTVVTYDAKGLVTGSSELSIASGSANYLEYDSTNHTFGAKVDTTVTENSTKLVTSGAVHNAITSAMVGGVKYQGTWDITSATDFSGITLPAKKGDLYYVTGTGPKTIGGIEWNAGDYLLVNADVASGGSLSGKVEKVDNTESADIVRLAATQTLTNKTIDADDNTILDLELDNFKSGVVQTAIRASSSASDTAIATEKAIASALEAKIATFDNPALTTSGGVCSWTITTALSPNCICNIREKASGDEVYCEVTYASGTITVKMNSSSNISAGTYTAVVLG